MKIKNFSPAQIFFGRKSYSIYLVVVLSLLLLGACKHDDLSVPMPNENVRPAADFIKNNYEMKLFHAALSKVGYLEQLNSAGPFTVLVPTDAAFNRLGIYNVSDFDKMNVDSLKKIIGYHIMPRKLRVEDIPSNGIDVRYATLEGSELYVSKASFNPNGGAENELYFSGSEAIRRDVVVANGTLHLLGNVMKPQFEKTVQQWLSQHAAYSVFVQALKKFNLWDQLATAGPYTIFAPDNKALANVGITEASLDAMDVNKYVGARLFGAYILYDRHFFCSDGQVFSRINSSGGISYFLKNDTYYMNYSGGKMYPDFTLGFALTLRSGNGISDFIVKTVSSNLTAKNDNLCNNGLVHHMVDGLVRPEQALKN